jgi:hypothetical protein
MEIKHEPRKPANQPSVVGEPAPGLTRLAEQRGLKPETLHNAGIGIAEGNSHAGWWSIPYPHRSGTWKHRYRNPNNGGRPKYLDDPGATPHLYNPGLVGPGEEEVWFAEGEFDTLVLIEHGYRAVGIHGAGNVPAEDTGTNEIVYRENFKKAWTMLFDDTLNIVAFDNDDTGRRNGRILARALEGVVFDGWTGDYKDLNEWHIADPGGLAVSLKIFRDESRISRGMPV